MQNKTLRTLLLLTLTAPMIGLQALACTNLIVGKKASKDGSVIVTYSCDDYGAYGFMNFLPGGKHAKGTMRPLYHYESNNYLGEIPEAEETYTVVGLMNEHQLTIHETTFGGREELTDTITGMMDYGSLMFVTYSAHVPHDKPSRYLPTWHAPMVMRARESPSPSPTPTRCG